MRDVCSPETSCGKIKMNSPISYEIILKQKCPRENVGVFSTCWHKVEERFLAIIQVVEPTQLKNGQRRKCVQIGKG